MVTDLSLYCLISSQKPKALHRTMMQDQEKPQNVTPEESRSCTHPVSAHPAKKFSASRLVGVGEEEPHHLHPSLRLFSLSWFSRTSAHWQTASHTFGLLLSTTSACLSLCLTVLLSPASSSSSSGSSSPPLLLAASPSVCLPLPRSCSPLLCGTVGGWLGRMLECVSVTAFRHPPPSWVTDGGGEHVILSPGWLG